MKLGEKGHKGFNSGVVRLGRVIDIDYHERAGLDRIVPESDGKDVWVNGSGEVGKDLKVV